MICKPCQLGADILKYQTKPVDRMFSSFHSFRIVSELLHAQCKGGTHCDCQHREESLINHAQTQAKNSNQA